MLSQRPRLPADEHAAYDVETRLNGVFWIRRRGHSRVVRVALDAKMCGDAIAKLPVDGMCCWCGAKVVQVHTGACLECFDLY